MRLMFSLLEQLVAVFAIFRRFERLAFEGALGLVAHVVARFKFRGSHAPHFGMIMVTGEAKIFLFHPQRDWE